MSVEFPQVSDVIDRVLGEWLYPAQSQPTRLTLTSNMSDSSTDFTYNDSAVPPEESDLITNGTILEIGSEQIVGGDINTAINTISNAVRGWNGTVPTAHESGAAVIVAPTFPRRMVFNAIGDAIRSLWPRLYTTKVDESVTVVQHLAEVDSEAARILRVSDTIRYDELVSYDLRKTNAVESGMAIVTYATGPVDIEYVVKPRRPMHEAEVLSELNVDDSWIQVIVLKTMLNIIHLPDMASLLSDFLVDKLNLDNNRTGTAGAIRDGLVQLYEYQMGELINARQVDEQPYDQVVQYSI